MKLQHENEEQIKTLAAEQRTVNKEQQLVGRIKPHPGHKVWEFNLETGEIMEAEFKTISLHTFTGVNGTQNTVTKRIDAKPNALYCSALNKRNAIKKFIPMYESLVQQGRITPGQFKP